MTTKDVQLFTLAVSPAQRWALFANTRGAAQKYKGSAGRVYRRFVRAFSLDVIRNAAIKSVAAEGTGQVSKKQMQNREPAMFEATMEVVEFVVERVMDVEHDAATEEELGELFDRLDDIKAKRDLEPVTAPAYNREADAPMWDEDEDEEEGQDE